MYGVPTNNFSLGLDKDKIAQYLRTLADKLENNDCLPQSLERSTIAEKDDWEKQVIIFEYIEKVN